MICPKCGRNIPDGTVCPCSQGQVLSSNPAVNMLKTLGSSTPFLVFAILMSLVPVLSIISQASLQSNMGDLMYYAMQLDLDPSVLYPAMDALGSVSVGSAIAAAIPSILIAVGVWITYVSCRNTQSGNVSTAGMTICKVLVIINLVCVCLAGAVLAIVFVIALAKGVSDAAYYGGYDDGTQTAVTAVLVVFLIIFVVVIALAILYQISVVKTINRIKATAVSGVPNNRIPNFLIVMNYILAVCSALGGILNLFTSPIMGFSGLVSAASMILISILLSKYRAGMAQLMYPPVQPAYPQQPMPPQGPWN